MEAKKDDSNKINLSLYGLNFDCMFQIPGKYNSKASWLVSKWWSDYMLGEAADVGNLHKAIDQIKLNFPIEREVSEGVTKVFEFGAKKYGCLNFSMGLEAKRLVSAFRRHIYWYPVVNKEENDQETSLPHEFHAICSLLMLIENILNGRLVKKE